MTDKEQIICKYKFEDKEKFNGKTYCTCFCELCEDSPLCDDNCQIYEDFKQLARKTQECEVLQEQNQKLQMQLCNECGERDDYNIPCKMIRDLDYWLQKEIEENDRYRKALEEIEKQCKCYGRSKYTQEFDREYGGELDTNILDIITKAKDGNNE